MKGRDEMGILMMFAMTIGVALAPRYGVDTRPGFDGHFDWRNEAD